MARYRLSGGWNGTIPRFVLNLSSHPRFLYASYNTTRNGRADEIVCPPHAYLFLIDKGSAEEFADYVVETDLSKLPQDSLAHQDEWSWALIIEENV